MRFSEAYKVTFYLQQANKFDSSAAVIVKLRPLTTQENLYYFAARQGGCS